MQTPTIVLEKHAELVKLCESSKDGRLLARDVAKYFGVDINWLLHATYAGAVPFAFGTNKGVGRGSTVFHVLPLYNYAVQNHVLKKCESGAR